MNWHAGFLQSIKFFAAQRNYVAVACSGGADSVFLTHALFSVYGEKLKVLIVNHNLQKNSTQIANQAKVNLQKFGINSEILTWNHEKILTGIEEKARIARYNLIANYCNTHKIETVFLGHHIDDKIETFFMNSVRGSGLAGLASMREISKRNAITYIRPMVHMLEKCQIVEYLKFNKIEWLEDETNSDAQFTRNKLRQMLHLETQQKLGIIQTIKNLEAIYDAKIAEIENFVENCGTLQNLSFAIKIESIEKLPDVDFRYFILCVIFEKIYKFSYFEVRQETIENILQWLESENTKATFLKCIFYKKNGLLHIVPEWQRLDGKQCIAGMKNQWNGLCEITSYLTGEIVPLAKLPIELRKSLQIKEKFWEIAHLPALICDGKVSVPHLGVNLGIFEFDVKVV